MARIKYNDTVEGWQERGYKVTADALNQKLDKRMVNREGKRLFSWGQVVPLHYRGYSEAEEIQAEEELWNEDS